MSSGAAERKLTWKRFGSSTASSSGLASMTAASSSRLRTTTGTPIPKRSAISASRSRATVSGRLRLESTTLPLCTSVLGSS